jgi:uncharacterized membrane protein YdbT with pleckstrin-like domain
MSVQLRITPLYIAKQAWIESIIVGFWSFLLIGVYPAIAILIHAAKNNEIGPSTIMWCAIATVLLTVLPMWGYVFLKRNNYQRTYYEFDEEKLIYYDGFINISRKEIFYQRVVEVNFTQNIIQRPFQVGTVLLSTAATGQGASVANSGIKIKDLADPEATYEKIKAIIYAKLKNGHI